MDGSAEKIVDVQRHLDLRPRRHDPRSELAAGRDPKATADRLAPAGRRAPPRRRPRDARHGDGPADPGPSDQGPADQGPGRSSRARPRVARRLRIARGLGGRRPTTSPLLSASSGRIARRCPRSVAGAQARRAGAGEPCFAFAATARPPASRRRRRPRAFFERRFLPLEIRPASGAGFLTGYYEPEAEGRSRRPRRSRPRCSPGRPTSKRSPPERRGPACQPASPPPGALRTGRSRPIRTAPRSSTARSDRSRSPHRLAAATTSRSSSCRCRARAASVCRTAGRSRIALRRPQRSSLHVDRPRRGARGADDGRGCLARQAEGLASRQPRRRQADHAAQRVLRLLPHRGRAGRRRGNPSGGAGLPHTPWRSIAVEPLDLPYGLPVWLEDGPAALRRDRAVPSPYGRRGHRSAILGPARADLFHGSGAEAGSRAGVLRHPMRFVVLWPKAAP